MDDVSERALPPFSEAWAKKEAVGYRYNGDALENVAFGYSIAREELAALTPTPPKSDLCERALLMCAPSHQGGHSGTGAAIAEALDVPFPLTVPSLREAAIARGFMPYDLWPWLEKMENAQRREP